tara:strand:+ start:2049 stop:3245 length:1197 start_codon:yes stop_codon:yes gene_type:complete
MASRQEDLQEESIGQDAYERALEEKDAKQQKLQQVADEKQEELAPLETVGATLAEEPVKDLFKQSAKALSSKGKQLGKQAITTVSDVAETKLKALALKHQASIDSLVERGGPLRDSFASLRNKLIPGRPLAATRPAGPSLASAFDDALGGRGVVGGRSPASQVLARFKNSGVDTSLLPTNSYFKSSDVDSDADYAPDAEDLARKARRSPAKFRAKTSSLPVKQEGDLQDALNPMREELARRAQAVSARAGAGAPREITSILSKPEPSIPRIAPSIPTIARSDPNIAAAAENTRSTNALDAGTAQLKDAKASAKAAGDNLDEGGKIITTGAKAEGEGAGGLAGALEGTTDAAEAEGGINPFIDILDAGLGIASLFGLAHKDPVPTVAFNPVNVGVQHGV